MCEMSYEAELCELQQKLEAAERALELLRNRALLLSVDDQLDRKQHGYEMGAKLLESWADLNRAIVAADKVLAARAAAAPAAEQAAERKAECDG